MSQARRLYLQSDLLDQPFLAPPPVLGPLFMQRLLNTAPRHLLNASLRMILLVYNAENWNIDEEYIPLNFIHIYHWPLGSPWTTFTYIPVPFVDNTRFIPKTRKKIFSSSYPYSVYTISCPATITTDSTRTPMSHLLPTLGTKAWALFGTSSPSK